MESVYFYCAAIGGGFLVLQTLLLFIGVGDADVDADLSPEGDASDVASGHGILLQLSFKTVVAFVTFFGLTGLACVGAEMSTGATLGISIAAGLAAFWLVAYLMSLLLSLQSTGTIDLSGAVGSSAKVYLRIPEKNSGFGKITVAVQGRTVTEKAVTRGEGIPTGSEVIIDGMTSGDTFEVSTRQ